MESTYDSNGKNAESPCSNKTKGKGASLYLEKKVELETELALERVYKYYLNRADKFWAGLWTHLVTEQTKMRPLKSLEGLTRGRGVGKNKRNLWVVMLRCVEVEERMQPSSGQHKEVGKCMRQRNYDNL